MRVLLITQNYSQRLPEERLSLAGRIAKLLLKYAGNRVTLAVAYEDSKGLEQPAFRDGCSFYPIHMGMSLGLSNEDIHVMKQELLRIIESFSPDIVECFGCEFPFGLISEDISIPVVIHMMGFLNIYYPAIMTAIGCHTSGAPGYYGEEITDLPVCRKPPLQTFRDWEEEPDPAARRMDIIRQYWDRDCSLERRNLLANRCFMGRTDWDRNIVKYYSPESAYFSVPEPISSLIYRAAGSWRFRRRDTLRLFTFSSGDDRKGNEIILQTGRLLKELLGLDIIWKVAGNPAYMGKYEKWTGIRREDAGVDVIGWVTPAQIVEELTEADFFIHPSIVDNSPNAVCEAQLIGCPVIASYCGGTPQLVEDRVTGFLYPYAEPHTLAFLIGNLRNDEETLSAISERAVQMSLLRHDPEKIALLTCNVYEEIIARYRSEDRHSMEGGPVA